MNGTDIDKLTRKHEPLPDDAGLCDMMLYHILTSIYVEYRKGIKSRDVAKVEKNNAIKQHSELELWERIFREHSHRMVEISGVLIEANKNGCPICKKVSAIFDGRLNYNGEKENGT